MNRNIVVTVTFGMTSDSVATLANYSTNVGPYTLKHSSSNALTIIVDTWEKNAPDTLAYNGFANANLRSRVTSVETLASGSDAPWGCAQWFEGYVGWKCQVVSSVSNREVVEDATA